MKFSNRLKWKRILLIFVCLFALSAVVRGSYAAYTSQAFQRGVARHGNTEKIRFTSNYLQNCASGTEPANYSGRTILYAETSKQAEEISFDIYIYNYANGNTDLTSEREIKYDLTITFNGDNEEDYSVISDDGKSFTKNNGTSYTLNNQTLASRSPDSHKYTLKFPGKDIDKLKITVTAVPTNLSITNNQILAAIIAPCTGATTNKFHAEGKYVDQDNETPTDYAGFNYEISISSGTANATLTWKTDTVEIDKFFLQNLGKNDKEIADILSSGTLTFQMNQSTGNGDYLIPFYIKNKNKIPKTWEQMVNDKIIQFSAEETTVEETTVEETTVEETDP